MTLSLNPIYSMSPSPADPTFKRLSDTRLSLLDPLTAFVQAPIHSLDSGSSLQIPNGFPYLQPVDTP